MSALTSKTSPWLRVASIGFITIWLLMAAFPFVWTLWGSFKVQGDFFSRQNWLNALYGILSLIHI